MIILFIFLLEHPYGMLGGKEFIQKRLNVSHIQSTLFITYRAGVFKVNTLYFKYKNQRYVIANKLSICLYGDKIGSLG